MTEPNRLTPEQAAIVGAFTGYLTGPFNDMHAYIERIMGRPVWTHEMADPKVMGEIKEKATADFLSICALARDKE